MLIVSLKRGWFVRWRRPIDGGQTWRGLPVLGQNKTWLGAGLYLGGGAVIGGLLGLAGRASAPVFDARWGAVVGATVGAAYSVGEIVNSFVKRRLGVAPGKVVDTRWRHMQVAVDLADGIILASVVYLLWGVSLPMAAAVLAFGLALHISTDALMRHLSLKRDQRGRAHHRNGQVVETAGTEPLDRR